MSEDGEVSTFYRDRGATPSFYRDPGAAPTEDSGHDLMRYATDYVDNEIGDVTDEWLVNAGQRSRDGVADRARSMLDAIDASTPKRITLRDRLSDVLRRIEQYEAEPD